MRSRRGDTGGPVSGLTIFLDGIHEAGPVFVDKICAERLNALQGPLALLDEPACGPGHGLRVGGIGGGELALFHNVPEGGKDEVDDMVHLGR